MIRLPDQSLLCKAKVTGVSARRASLALSIGLISSLKRFEETVVPSLLAELMKTAIPPGRRLPESAPDVTTGRFRQKHQIQRSAGNIDVVAGHRSRLKPAGWSLKLHCGYCLILVVKKGSTTNGRVAGAGGIVRERINTNGRVVAAIVVKEGDANRRPYSRSQPCSRRATVLPICCVEVAGGIAKERISAHGPCCRLRRC